VRIEKTSGPAFGSLTPLAPMRLPSHKQGRYFRFCSSVPYFSSGIELVHMWALIENSSPLSGGAVTQPFYNGNRRDGIRAATTEFFGNRQIMHAEGGAFFPSTMREDPLSVSFNHVAAQFGQIRSLPSAATVARA